MQRCCMYVCCLLSAGSWSPESPDDRFRSSPSPLGPASEGTGSREWVSVLGLNGMRMASENRRARPMIVGVSARDGVETGDRASYSKPALVSTTLYWCSSRVKLQTKFRSNFITTSFHHLIKITSNNILLGF